MRIDFTPGQNPTHTPKCWCAECRKLTRIWDVQNDENYDGIEPENVCCSECHEPYSRGEQIEYGSQMRSLYGYFASGALKGTVQL